MPAEDLLSIDCIITVKEERRQTRCADGNCNVLLRRQAKIDAPDALQRAVEANVIVQPEHLRSHASVAEKLKADRLRLHGWAYHIATGDVTVYDADQSQFVPL